MIKQVEGKFLEELVKDCITYRLSEKEVPQYIESRFKRISEAPYKLKKAHILSDKSTQLWLHLHFSRIGSQPARHAQGAAGATGQARAYRQFRLRTGVLSVRRELSRRPTPRAIATSRRQAPTSRTTTSSRPPRRKG